MEKQKIHNLVEVDRNQKIVRIDITRAKFHRHLLSQINTKTILTFVFGGAATGIILALVF